MGHGPLLGLGRGSLGDFGFQRGAELLLVLAVEKHHIAPAVGGNALLKHGLKRVAQFDEAALPPAMFDDFADRHIGLDLKDLAQGFKRGRRINVERQGRIVLLLHEKGVPAETVIGQLDLGCKAHPCQNGFDRVHVDVGIFHKLKSRHDDDDAVMGMIAGAFVNQPDQEVFIIAVSQRLDGRPPHARDLDEIGPAERDGRQQNADRRPEDRIILRQPADKGERSGQVQRIGMAAQGFKPGPVIGRIADQGGQHDDDNSGKARAQDRHPNRRPAQ